LQAEAFALAKSIADGPTIAIRAMKDNLDEALMFDFRHRARSRGRTHGPLSGDIRSQGSSAGVRREAQGGI